MQRFAPMSIDRLGVHLAEAGDGDRRWLLLLEFLEEYEHEPAPTRAALLQPEPPGTGDDRWDALLAGVAEWLSTSEGRAGPDWDRTPRRTLAAPWCPYELASLQRLAGRNAPAELRRHGVLIDPYDLSRG
ncbi:MAG: hypothetical protein ACR2G7_13425 [Acidimicrobiales bacterium]